MLSSDHLTLRLFRLKSSDSWSQKREGLSFLFFDGGSGRCISQGSSLSFSPGDVLILNGPDAAKVVSSNGELSFWSFSLSIEHLFPLFAGSEISLLQTVAERLRSLRLYPANSPLAMTCNSLIKDVPPAFTLDHRSQILRLATAVLTKEFEAARVRSTSAGRMEEHIVQVFETLTADEILHLPIEDLAKRFGCSRRHLNRLFHQYFRLSVASLKMEMRLLKALSLLRDPNAKIINVAENCGFHHLGLFNTCFRKRFGTSPGEWRKRSRSVDSLDEAILQVDPECSFRSNGLCPWARRSALGQPGLPDPPGLSRPGPRSRGSRVRQQSKCVPACEVAIETGGIDPAAGQLTFKAKRSGNPSQHGSH